MWLLFLLDSNVVYHMKLLIKMELSQGALYQIPLKIWMWKVLCI